MNWQVVVTIFGMVKNWGEFIGRFAAWCAQHGYRIADCGLRIADDQVFNERARIFYARGNLYNCICRESSGGTTFCEREVRVTYYRSWPEHFNELVDKVHEVYRDDRLFESSADND